MKLRRRRGRNKSGVKQKAEERDGTGGRAFGRSGRGAVTLAAAVQSAARHGWRATNTIARLNPHPAADHTAFPFSPTAMQLCVVSALFFMAERCSGET